MRKKFVAFVLIVMIVVSLSAFAACTTKHAYLVGGIYECEAVAIDGKSIDKITIGIREITDSDYKKYDPHIVEREDKVYYIDFDVWIDGELIKKDYKTSYEFKLRYFYISFDIDVDETFITFVTEKDDNGDYYISAKIFGESSLEFVLKKIE